jgi:hypothetical protein
MNTRMNFNVYAAQLWAACRVGHGKRLPVVAAAATQVGHTSEYCGYTSLRSLHPQTLACTHV